MKLVRVGPPGQERPGILDPAGVIRDLSGTVADLSGAWLADECLAQIRSQDVTQLPVVDADGRLGPCVAGTGKVVCVGLNFADHAAETGSKIPAEPILFMKATSAICGPNDPIVLPRGSAKTDWEVELAVVIGTRAKHVSEDAALQYIAGYAVFNDVSARDFQIERSGQWTKGKSCDSFGPIGPWLVTREEITNPQDLAMWVTVNGEKMQDGSTQTMIFNVPHLVSYISDFMTLHPGDIIATGTPPGVALGMPTPRYLRAGDRVELGIAGLGVQSHAVVAASSD